VSAALTTKLLLYGLIVGEQILLTFCFFRFWRASREPLFAFFAAGFAVMAIHRVALGFSEAGQIGLEQQSSVFVWRVLSYLLILAGVVLKNLQKRSSRPPA
jgi:Family of unknown function (DUF5985)